MSNRGSVESYQFYKLVLVGDAGVGKTSLLLQFTDQIFSDRQVANIGVEFKVRLIEIDGEMHKLEVWDTAGQERFRTITSSYYRGATGVIVVYDVSDRKTFENVKQWFTEIEHWAEESSTRILVGNKCDLIDKREVSFDEGKMVARDRGILFIETSAKLPHNVDEAFITITRQIHSVPTIVIGNSRRKKICVIV